MKCEQSTASNYSADSAVEKVKSCLKATKESDGVNMLYAYGDWLIFRYSNKKQRVIAMRITSNQIAITLL
jgi:hypothetical protein